MSLLITRIDHPDQATLDSLRNILIACTGAGASVGFMNPLSLERAAAFWSKVGKAVQAGERILFVAEFGGKVVGTVQVVVDMPENQPHRGDISKLLVHPEARKLGAGDALMRAAEQAARDAGKTLLVLDTASAEAERLYRRQGWELCGEIPDFALWPDGGLVPTKFFYKRLA